jgi:2-polyprenyl-3-methyl-5-hydroxy-6-metoxy-1,4-benzoquinol methylase
MRWTMNDPGYREDHIHFYSEEIPALLAGHIDRVEWHTLLDAGCGDGCLLYALERKGYLDAKVAYALDAAATRIERVKLLGLDLIYVVEDACEMKSIPDGSIDLLLSTQVIEHVPDDEQMVREVNRVLRAGGMFYLSTVFKKWYGWYYHRCNGKWRIEPTHLREYSEERQLLDILDRNGLEVSDSSKSLAWYSILDFVLHKLNASGWAYRSRLLTILRKVKIPIPGYYNWELVGVKLSRADTGPRGPGDAE